MQAKVISVLKSFLTFAPSFQPHHVHNMLVLMFDMCFKNLQFIKDYVGLELAMQVVVDYDQEILMPLLLIVYHALTPNLQLLHLLYLQWLN
jgi:CO/xanthine dehydrogenase Mo-binding subunit